MPFRTRRMAGCAVLLAAALSGCAALAPEPSPTPSPTLAPSATASATHTAAPTQPGDPRATWTPRPTRTSIPAPCEHDYFTALAGVQWSYAVSGSPAGDFSFSQQVSAQRPTGFSLSSRIGDQTYRHSWTCAEEGLTAQQFDGVAMAGIALAGGQITLETDAVSGLSLPADLAPGDQWQQTYTISGEQSLAGLPDSAVEGTVSSDYAVIGIEEISLPAGDFRALHVRSETVYDVTVGSFPFAFSPEIYGTTDAYYAETIGLVLVETEFSLMGDEQQVRIELLDYDFP